jgi:hypothetical protein
VWNLPLSSVLTLVPAQYLEGYGERRI